MSEQLVIILLIALTLVIVLIALAIPDDASPDDDSNDESIEMYTPTTIQSTDEFSDVSDAVVRQPSKLNDNEEQGEEHDDARRAADVLEEADR